MKIEFDTRYLTLVNGDLKTAMMLAVAVAKQKEADDTDTPNQYGNYWSMSRDEWSQMGFGERFSQEKKRKVLSELGLWIERKRGFPQHNEFHIKLEDLEDRLA